MSECHDAFLAKLRERLGELERLCSPRGYAVAFSGGIDSRVLLEGCHRLGTRLPLRALHVDHGLQPESPRWAEHCRNVARALGIDFEAVSVAVHADTGQSVEAAAREARYGALSALLGPEEMLLTAHHEDDQLETVFLRLMRGTGVRGLRGVLESGQLASGYVGRPLLTCSKAEISAAADRWELDWIEDPSNRDERFDRNYLRAAVLPALRQRWPAVARTVSRAARQMADAEEILTAAAESDARSITDLARIPIERLADLSAARQRNLLRYLVEANELPLPSAKQLEEVVSALGILRPDAQTCVSWPGADARIFGGNVYLMRSLPECSSSEQVGSVSPTRPWAGPEGQIALVESADPRDAMVFPDAWAAAGLSVRFRRGGERFRPQGAAHHRALKKLLQEAGIVPWMRSRIPLLYRNDELVGVGDLWVCDGARGATGSRKAWRVHWSKHPPLR
jgi:tRNA(Ile)-lysidine synthase